MIFVEALFVFVLIAFIWLVVTLVMFKKLNKARITGVLLIILAFVAVGAVIFVVGHFLEWHETNEMCGEMCHAMEGPYDSYTQPKNNTMMEVHFEEDVPCAQCHSGPGFVGLGTSFLPVPNEMLHQYVLGYDEDDFGGHVPVENCLKGCHEEAGVDWKFEAPMPKGQGYNEIDGVIEWDRREIYHPMTQNGTSLEALEKLETCLDCHDARDNSFGFAAEACHICHDIEEEELEAHGESTCSMATCHRDSDGNPVQPKLTGHNTVTDHCMECHSRDHPEDAFVPYTTTNSKGTTLVANSSFCSDCHKETYEELSVTNPKHFQENDCTECHLEHKTRPDCLMCHDEGSEYTPDHIITQPFENCTNCHERGGHDPKKVTFSAYAQESGLVSRDFCNTTACHKTDVFDRFDDADLHTQQRDFTQDCLKCHDVHEADVDCSECHVDGGIAPKPEHSQSQPFDDCTSCHTDGHIPSQLNFTFFEDTFNLNLSDDFCVECHSDEKTELADKGLGHAVQDCTTCHESHKKEDVDCTSCHSATGIAPEPPHLAQTPYDDCTSCHESGHAPKEITFGTSIQTDFCAEVSCHGGPGGTATIFENYGGRHTNFPEDCKNCHTSHEVGKKCSETSGCHSGATADHDPANTYEDCVNCHESSHDPLKKAPSLGSTLSQRDYMSNYFVLNTTNMTQSFRWIERGNHDLSFDPRNGDCAQCHLDSETMIYPVSAQPLMNVSRQDCSGSCHDWIDPITTGTPISLINDSSNPFFRHFEIFNSTSSGGCVGTCHQSDPSIPVLDGSGHGTITSCLNSDCHGDGFTLFGSTHTAHQDMLTWTTPDLECYSVCHKGPQDYGEPIDGGCYDCHKSGHDPRILDSSPCYSAGCHAQNWDP